MLQHLLKSACGVDESEALVEIHQRTVGLLKRREGVAAVPMVAD